MTVGLVLVSHSARLAAGAVDVARQMAPDVVLLAAGGTGDDDAGIGTSPDRVLAAVEEALGSGGVVVLTDLGSAVLTAESVLEMLDDPDQVRVRVPDAPFVEGAVAAAVAAQQGGDLDAVEAAARAAGAGFGPAQPAPAPRDDGDGGRAGPAARATVIVRNPLGLHARPAAVLARAVSGFDARVLIAGADGASVLGLMSLGARGGDQLVVEARGPQADAAVAAVVAMVEEGFGETEPR